MYLRDSKIKPGDIFTADGSLSPEQWIHADDECQPQARQPMCQSNAVALFSGR